MAETSDRAKILNRYGLPDAATFELEPKQHAQQTLRVTVSYPSGTVSLSTGHLSSLAHEIQSVDRGLAEQIQTLVRKLSPLKSQP